MRALRKVLVVDDDPVVGKSFDRVLSGKGYAVITASDGQEALSKLEAEDYDVVFTDIKMPGMNGIEVAERVKQKRPWLPVVIVTGYGSTDNETRAEAAGVSGFLRKPLSPEMIEGSAQKALLERDAAPAQPKEKIEAAPAPQPPAAEPAPRSAAAMAKNIALFFAAPFVGLAYILVFPLVGLGMLAWMGAKAAGKHHLAKQVGPFVKSASMFIVGPFLGLAYVLLFPFIGIAMMTWIGVRALVKRSDSE
jgi:CheY-like chemotaxis protein